MKDYYDAIPPESEPKTKECPACGGSGGEIEYMGYLPNCRTCHGTGEVPMTREDFLSEKDYQRDCKIEDERIKESDHA